MLIKTKNNYSNCSLHEIVAEKSIDNNWYDGFLVCKKLILYKNNNYIEYQTYI